MFLNIYKMSNIYFINNNNQINAIYILIFI